MASSNLLLSLFVVCALHIQANEAQGGGGPEVVSKGGELSFYAALGKDISFQTTGGGKLRLNGIDIQDASSLRGPKGDLGSTGASGTKGEPGASGTKGDKGAAGLTGPQGPKGESGVIGQKGIKGDTGAAGQVGRDGRDGNPGDKGATGSQGPIGPKGVRGDVGTNGAAGSKGEKGEQGAQGSVGPKGESGTNGTPGGAGSKGEAGSQGPAGPAGSAGPAGPPGPPGPPGKDVVATSSSSSTCSNRILPACPFWLNMNASRVPAYGSFAIRFATAGFSELYHPYFQPSYVCRFNDDTKTLQTAYVGVKALTDPVTKQVFYTIECTPPAWTFSPVTESSALVNVSIWFLGEKEILFSGKKLWNQITYFVEWNSAKVQGSSTSKQVVVSANGLNPGSTYMCKFTDNAAASQSINAVATKPTNSRTLTCAMPTWNVAGDTRTSVTTTLSVWQVVSGKVVGEVTFNGTGRAITFDRCSDGVMNGAETDVDCGGSCTAKCAVGKKCKTDSDCQGSSSCDSSICKQACNNGWIYKGICLRSSIIRSNADSIPSGCNAYQPSMNWGFNNYQDICNHFGNRPGLCANIDNDYHGGRCTNYRAIIAYENSQQTSADVWVHRSTFTWSPTGSTQGDCRMVETPPSTAIYACRL